MAATIPAVEPSSANVRSRDASPSGSSSSVPGSSKQMILRIKRKRNQDPIDALIIQQNERRQKRRSIVLPDAVSSATKAGKDTESAASRGVFRLAETVSLESFSDPIEARKLHQRITALSGKGLSTTRPSVRSKLSQSLSLPDIAPFSFRTDGTEDAEEANDKLARSTASLGAQGRSTPSTRPTDRIKALASEQIEREKDRQQRSRSSTPTGMRFKVIQKEGAGLRRSGSSASLRKLRGHTGNKPWQVPQRPPEIRSRKANEAEAVFGKIIDAEADSKKQSARRAANAKMSPAQSVDADMAGLDSKFAEMLGDYLRSNDIEPSRDIRDLVEAEGDETRKRSPSISETSESEDDGDYVYDVYYRDMAPVRATSQGSAETGLQPAIVPGHEKHSGTNSEIPDSMALPRVRGGEVVPPEFSSSMNAVIAQLEGFEDSDEELEHAQDDGGFESFDEGEDEDSNDEGFYRNDYPEQELPDDEQEYDLGSDSEEQDNDPYGEYMPQSHNCFRNTRLPPNKGYV